MMPALSQKVIVTPKISSNTSLFLSLFLALTHHKQLVMRATASPQPILRVALLDLRTTLR